jgi:hypothetical protein
MTIEKRLGNPPSIDELKKAPQEVGSQTTKKPDLIGHGDPSGLQ